MLRDAVEHVVEVVALAGNAVAQPRFRKSSNGLDQPFMSSLRGGDGLAPRGLRGFRRNGWKIIQAGWLPFLACKPDHPGIVPDSDVQEQFPNAVNVRHRPGSRGSGIDIRE